METRSGLREEWIVEDLTGRRQSISPGLGCKAKSDSTV